MKGLARPKLPAPGLRKPEALVPPTGQSPALTPYRLTTASLACDWIILVASTLWPAWLWWSDRLLATDVLLLFIVEAILYHFGVLARILSTTAPPEPGQLPRLFCAIRHAVAHAIWLGPLVFALLAVTTSGLDPSALMSATREHLSRLTTPLIAQSAAVIAACIAFTVLRRCDYIDTHLNEPPSRFARYGYSYVFGLGFLLLSAGILRVVGEESEHFAGYFNAANSPLIPPAVLVLWLCVQRLLLKALNLLVLAIQGRLAGTLATARNRIEAARSTAQKQS